MLGRLVRRMSWLERAAAVLVVLFVCGGMLVSASRARDEGASDATPLFEQSVQFSQERELLRVQKGLYLDVRDRMSHQETVYVDSLMRTCELALECQAIAIADANQRNLREEDRNTFIRAFGWSVRSFCRALQMAQYSMRPYVMPRIARNTAKPPVGAFFRATGGR